MRLDFSSYSRGIVSERSLLQWSFFGVSLDVVIGCSGAFGGVANWQPDIGERFSSRRPSCDRKGNRCMKSKRIPDIKPIRIRWWLT